MDQNVTLLLVFLGCGLIACSKVLVRHYHYVNMPMNWTDAQHYCREKYTDLATFESTEDIERLNRSELVTTWAWIGLRDDPESWKGTMGNEGNSWRWSANDQITGYHNWQPGDPNYGSEQETCVSMDSLGLWHDMPCGSNSHYVCYTETNTGQKVYEYRNTWSNWNMARQYCTSHYTDLAMIENSMENAEVRSLLSHSGVWIGLYRKPWTWSDQTQRSFTNWMNDKPDNYYQNEHCAAEDNGHEWDDYECAAHFAFICQEVEKTSVSLRIELRTGVNVTDPLINNQILQQLGSVFQSRGFTRVALQWKIQPRKESP